VGKKEEKSFFRENLVSKQVGDPQQKWRRKRQKLQKWCPLQRMVLMDLPTAKVIF
jgi:hypothetical protein